MKESNDLPIEDLDEDDKPLNDVPKMTQLPLDVYAMAFSDVFLRKMEKLGVEETVTFTISRVNTTNSAIIRFHNDQSSYVRLLNKWTRRKDKKQ